MSKIIKYYIVTEDQQNLEYEIQLDPMNSIMKRTSSIPPMPWTNLENCKCESCPLNVKKHKQCPVAVNLSDFIETFKNQKSFSKVSTKVVTGQRTYLKESDLQTTLKSIFGLIMATSGCPILDPLRPMAKFHLPFATIEETMMRSISMFLLRKYMEDENENVQLNLDQLNEEYRKIAHVNQWIAKRLNTITRTEEGEADKNAISQLNNYTQFLAIEIECNLDSIKKIFD
ncbi:hypothetical protein N9N67_02070 [Bacteriovoracaceae bacterium]|nr:hypothetical protein [Bacteriovoracaceae bacterium]